MLNNNDLDTCEILLSNIDYYSLEELEYIYRKIMLFYQNSMFEIIEILKDKEIIDIIKADYYSVYSKYMIARNMLDNLVVKNNDEIEYDNIPSETELGRGVHLYYSSNSLEPNKCYFINDLKSVREESLNNILNLINDFKKGEVSRIKPLSFVEKFIELKDDQIRIVLKPMGENNYSVLGVFIKKSDNDRAMYRSVFKRPVSNKDDEYSLKVEEYYTKYIEENQRKGSR